VLILHAAVFRNIAAGDASRLIEEVALYIDDGDGVLDEGKDRKVGLGAFGSDQRLDLTGMDAVWPSGTLLTIFLVGQIPPGEQAVGCVVPRSGPAGSRGGVLVACSGAAVFLLLLACMACGRRRFPMRRLAAAAASCSIAIVVCLALSCDGGGHGEPPSLQEIQVQLDELTVDGVAAAPQRS
jgi:hypothetical protein